MEHLNRIFRSNIGTDNTDYSLELERVNIIIIKFKHYKQENIIGNLSIYSTDNYLPVNSTAAN